MQGEFHGMPTGVLENDVLRVEYLTESGPRLVRLVPKATGQNLLAELPDAAMETPHGEFRLHGGHRLWHAPEVRRRTYIPDNGPLTVTPIDHGVELVHGTEPQTGIAKAMRIELDPSRPRLTIHHTLHNHGMWPVELAPWAITQAKLGGSAVIPQQVGPIDPDGLLPNRQLSLWSYSQLHDPRLQLDDDMIVIDAHVKKEAFKIGIYNPDGWMGYFIDGHFLVKRFGAEPGQPYPDGGCNCELYINDEFVELESLAPLLPLAPDESVSHTEVWELHSDVVAPTTSDALKSVAQTLANQAI